MGATFIILGTSMLALLLAGYFAQQYLPPPKPKIVGIDLGTTFSCVGLYHAVSGTVDVLEVQDGHRCIPSMVAFSDDGVLVGYKAMAQSEHNPQNTLYDSKRFIGKVFSKDDVKKVQKQYSFKLEADEYGMVHYVVKVNGTDKKVLPEEVGAIIIGSLKQAAEHNLTTAVNKVIMSVPAEFDDLQRNYTKKAASIAGLDCYRVINEPTAAALAYGLHKKQTLQTVLVVDLGGGTLDVSLLRSQGGMFLTQAMAGNNRLGGQDFNQRLLDFLLMLIEKRHGIRVTDKEDLQTLRLHVEETKLRLAYENRAEIKMNLHSLGNENFSEVITRMLFEELNADLFNKVLEPVKKVLEAAHLVKEDVDEIVLVGGSTRIPKVRSLIHIFFGKKPNTSVDPELAVVTGVSVQAGIIGGMWPLTVSAVELPTRVTKIHVH
ncbi:heat shock 70 kDa protein 13-like [Gigantopelta aegis]|uniref:heat shock 70 kDa protein 13-like n=1 Tax=Gigantopelta aegis TaxID=1735272 RepID=UPI001B88AD72|nr:heat shock 70 kDa protein 13-like [Gigantopelta aegis]